MAVTSSQPAEQREKDALTRQRCYKGRSCPRQSRKEDELNTITRSSETLKFCFSQSTEQASSTLNEILTALEGYRGGGGGGLSAEPITPLARQQGLRNQQRAGGLPGYQAPLHSMYLGGGSPEKPEKGLGVGSEDLPRTGGARGGGCPQKVGGQQKGPQPPQDQQHGRSLPPPLTDKGPGRRGPLWPCNRREGQGRG